MSEAYELEAILFMIKPQLQEMLSQGQFQTVMSNVIIFVKILI